MSNRDAENVWVSEWSPYINRIGVWRLAYRLSTVVDAAPEGRWLIYAEDRGYTVHRDAAYANHSIKTSRGIPGLNALRRRAQVHLALAEGIFCVDHVNESGTWATGALESFDSFARWLEVTTGMVSYSTMVEAAQPRETGYECAICTQMLDPVLAKIGVHPSCGVHE